MIRLRSILLPYDFSISSAQVLDYGLEMAAKTGAELHLLHVEIFHESSFLKDAENGSKAELFREKMLDDIHASADRQKLDLLDLTRLNYAILEDYAAAPAINQYSLEHEIDLIMMGTHGRRGMEKTMRQSSAPYRSGPYHLGSVAEAVVRTAPCSVLTFREQDRPGPFSDQLQKILVPIEFTSQTINALSLARYMAALFQASIEIVHVVESFASPPYYDENHVLVFNQAEVDRQALDQMRDMYHKSTGEAAHVDYTVLHGYPVDEILKLSEGAPGHLIVVSPNPVAADWEDGIGSTIERVVRMANCPVLTARRSSVEQKPRSRESMVTEFTS